jgi:glycosyltransferase involved in cell wall biosynthesis
MKITLAFTIYNKEDWIESILKSWIDNAEEKSELEIIIVFDDLKDKSKIIAEEYLKDSGINFQFLFADDKHEIYCNNLALERATGDYIIFIQDDNWLYDKGWDVVLKKTIQETNKVGAIALLAGAKIVLPSVMTKILNILRRISDRLFFKEEKFYSEFGLSRLESDREHKGTNFSQLNISSLPMGVWKTHVITRPFCVSRELLLDYGGLKKVFMPHTGDDVDLSLRLIGDGYQNLYISFDLVNISTLGDNKIHGSNKDNIKNAYKLNYLYHKEIINNSNKDYIEKIFDIDF